MILQLFLGLSDTTTDDQQWTCKKCTLVNSGDVNACIVCGGSKLRALATANDMTLRKGEFWYGESKYMCLILGKLIVFSLFAQVMQPMYFEESTLIAKLYGL